MFFCLLTISGNIFSSEFKMFRLLFLLKDYYFPSLIVFLKTIHFHYLCVCVFGLVHSILSFIHMMMMMNLNSGKEYLFLVWIEFLLLLFFFNFFFRSKNNIIHYVNQDLLNRIEKFFWKWNVPGSFFSAGLNWINKIHK